jgi:hypothetical protein
LSSLTTNRCPFGQVTKLDALPREEAIAFLLRRTASEDEAAAFDLADELGDLPLALDQAASYVEMTGMPLGEYLKLLRKRRRELLGLGEPASYKGTVGTTWNLAIEQVAIASPAAVQLLQGFAFLAPDAIPIDLFTINPDELPKELGAVVRDELLLNDAIAELHRFSLVDRGRTGLHIHRLVQAVVRSHLSQGEQDLWIERVIHLLEKSVPDHPEQPRNWPRWAELLPHILQALPYAADRNLALEPTARLLVASSDYLRVRGDLPQARAQLERALAIQEASYGPDHPEVARTLTNLGRMAA